MCQQTSTCSLVQCPVQWWVISISRASCHATTCHFICWVALRGFATYGMRAKVGKSVKKEALYSDTCEGQNKTNLCLIWLSEYRLGIKVLAWVQEQTDDHSHLFWLVSFTSSNQHWVNQSPAQSNTHDVIQEEIPLDSLENYPHILWEVILCVISVLGLKMSMQGIYWQGNDGFSLVKNIPQNINQRSPLPSPYCWVELHR